MTAISKTYKEIFYRVGKEVIAYFSGKENCLFLRTDFLKHNRLSDLSQPYEERIHGSLYEAEYKLLLSQYRKFKISEFVG